MKQTKQPGRPEPAALIEDAPELLTVKDVGLGDVFSPEFLERFEVHSYRNAARIIAAAGANELREVINALTSFSIRTYEIVKPGGSKTDIAKRLEGLMAASGWFECRISGDLHVRKTTKEIQKVNAEGSVSAAWTLSRLCHSP